MNPVFFLIYPTSVWDCFPCRKSHVWSGGLPQLKGRGDVTKLCYTNRNHVWKNLKFCESQTHMAPIALGRGSLWNVSLEKHSIWWCVPALQSPRHCLTSVWRMAALCSLAVSDSLSTSMCCLQSEFWLLRVSSFVCKARSSDSFLESSCFSWSIWKTRQLQNLRKFSSNSLHLTTTRFSLFSIGGNYRSSRKCHEFAYRDGPGLEEALLRQKNRWVPSTSLRPWVCHIMKASCQNLLVSETQKSSVSVQTMRKGRQNSYLTWITSSQWRQWLKGTIWRHLKKKNNLRH